MKLLAAVARVRELLDDTGGDAEIPWGIDDSLCEASNAQLVGYLDDARTEYRLRQPLRDGEASELTRPTALGNADGRVALDPRILALVSVSVLATARCLPRVSLRRLDREWPEWRAQVGEPEAYLEDDTDGQIRLVPSPTVDVPLALVVLRGPLGSLAWADRQQEIPEIPPIHHKALCYWAAKRAQEGRNEDERPQLAALWEDKFASLVGPKPTLKQLRSRAHLAAGMPVVRGLSIGSRRTRRWP